MVGSGVAIHGRHGEVFGGSHAHAGAASVVVLAELRVAVVAEDEAAEPEPECDGELEAAVALVLEARLGFLQAQEDERGVCKEQEGAEEVGSRVGILQHPSYAVFASEW